ncbi:MAG: 4Fe-4S binding protein [Sedimentisphaerales bacterium]|nr:4Fe-4S binding protein [Sedimentisphaerales bacterium]
MKRHSGWIGLMLMLSMTAWGVQRFPPPQFESGYQIPQTTTPMPHPPIRDVIDSAVFLVALGMASWLTLKKRSRKWIVGLMLFSLFYFGFFRNGCVCSVGSIGNIALAAFNSEYTLPAVVLVFFLAPLVFTLFFGRGFCAAVCPLGAMQDIVLIRPVRVPEPLEAALRLLAYVYLAFAVLFAATGSLFVICRYDPFVTFFRFNGNWNLWVLGISFLLISLFVGRPYCRFLCPYGVILRQLSRISRWRVKITPDECIQCRLCEQACPFGAVVKPSKPLPPAENARSKRTIAFLIVLLPILAALGGWIGSAMHPTLARAHPTVRLANRIDAEMAGLVQGQTDASEAFRASGQDVQLLRLEAVSIRYRFWVGGMMAGIALGLIAGGKLIASAVPVVRKEYEAHRAGCFACGRCFAYCPVEQKRRIDQSIMNTK